MIDAFSSMLWPLLACFVLVGIHAYLGIHVIARKVIFVDLALAQIAALGAVYGVFLGLSFDADPWAVKGISVLFTFLGALLFSFTRTHDEHIPHEAIIGIIYASALSMTVLFTSNLPHGSDEVRQMLAGSILWVTPKDVFYTAVLYAFIGGLHILFRKQFFALSSEIAKGGKSDFNVKLWDFIFYASFGLVVTSSVALGGVLLVFGYLVIPSVIGVMLAHTTKARLIVGWSIGGLISILGVILSYFLDLPSGPTIVVLLAAALLLLALILELIKKRSRKLGVFHLLFTTSVLVLIIFSKTIYQRIFFDEFQERKARYHALGHERVSDEEQKLTIKKALQSNDHEQIIEALKNIKTRGMAEFFPQILNFLQAKDHRVRELVVEVIAELKIEEAIPPLKKAFFKEADVFIKIEIAEALLKMRISEGLFFLAQVVSQSKSEFAKEDALMHLNDWLTAAPKKAKDLLPWLQKNRNYIDFDPGLQKFKSAEK